MISRTVVYVLSVYKRFYGQTRWLSKHQTRLKFACSVCCSQSLDNISLSSYRSAALSADTYTNALGSSPSIERLRFVVEASHPMELCLTAIADVEHKNVLAVATFMFSEWAIKVNSINIDTYVFRVDALADSNQQHQEQQDEWNAPCGAAFTFYGTTNPPAKALSLLHVASTHLTCASNIPTQAHITGSYRFATATMQSSSSSTFTSHQRQGSPPRFSERTRET